MKVILLQELKGKGGEGDVIDVADGFANNYLLTEGLAIKATKGNLKQLEQRKHNIAKREETRLEDAAKMKEALEKATVKVVAQVGDEGQLFGSVTTQMIADACKEQADIDVDKRRIELGKPIKTAGEHEVTVSIYRDIKGTIKVRVVGEGEEQAAPAEPEAAAEVAEAVEAAEAAASYMDITSFSREGLIDQLLFEGFTQDQAEYGAEQVGY